MSKQQPSSNDDVLAGLMAGLQGVSASEFGLGSERELPVISYHGGNGKFRTTRIEWGSGPQPVGWESDKNGNWVGKTLTGILLSEKMRVRHTTGKKDEKKKDILMFLPVIPKGKPILFKEGVRFVETNKHILLHVLLADGTYKYAILSVSATKTVESNNITKSVRQLVVKTNEAMLAAGADSNSLLPQPRNSLNGMGVVQVTFTSADETVWKGSGDDRSEAYPLTCQQLTMRNILADKERVREYLRDMTDPEGFIYQWGYKGEDFPKWSGLANVFEYALDADQAAVALGLKSAPTVIPSGVEVDFESFADEHDGEGDELPAFKNEDDIPF
jgi:hypothetical protein